MAGKKAGVISQARMTSTRLPGKVLMKAGGKTMLQHHVHRLQAAGLEVYVATTTNTTDDAIAAYAQETGIPCYRGDEQHVLSRFYGCAKENKLDVIVRVTSDCPLIDGHLIADALELYLQQQDEQVYLSNALVRTLPRGLDFEIFSFALLEEAYLNADKPEQLEHVTPYINQNKSGQVKLQHYTRTPDASQYRITLDTQEDLVLLRTLLEQYQAYNLPAEEIIQLLVTHPELTTINSHVEQKKLAEQLYKPDELALRRVTANDLLLVYNWVNDPEVRSRSFNSDPITLENHSRWFCNKLEDSSCFFYILEVKGAPAGQIRFDLNGNIALLSFLISEHYRGMGLGHAILQKGAAKLKQDKPAIREVEGLVQKGNAASIRAFEKAGFAYASPALTYPDAHRFTLAFA